MMISLPNVLGNLTLAEIEQRLGGKQAATSAKSTRKHDFVINTKLAEVALPIQGCEGANFFEHVVSGVTLLGE